MIVPEELGDGYTLLIPKSIGKRPNELNVSMLNGSLSINIVTLTPAGPMISENRPASQLDISKTPVHGL
jgi:hypothetical protein